MCKSLADLLIKVGQVPGFIGPKLAHYIRRNDAISIRTGGLCFAREYNDSALEFQVQVMESTLCLSG